MANRAHDWLQQAQHDLEHARHAWEAGDYDWACFAAQQAAEKALKGLFLGLGGEAWGHALTRLFEDLRQLLAVPQELIHAAKRLDKHYVLTRYPSGFDMGAPFHYYTSEEGTQAIADAQRIYDFCQQSLHQA